MVTPLEVKPELVIERVFDAPRQLVWQAWTDPQQMLKWGGPRSHPIVHGEGEFKVGGKWRACLRSVETGEDLWQGGEYREIKPPEKLVHTFHWEDDDGKPENEMLIEQRNANRAHVRRGWPEENEADPAPDSVRQPRAARRPQRRLVRHVRPP